MSKFWFKKRMKLKIEACYDTEEAAKFKGSRNWFQRFKKKRKMVLRRRTNKKKQVFKTNLEDRRLKIDTKLISTRFLPHL